MLFHSIISGNKQQPDSELTNVLTESCWPCFWVVPSSCPICFLTEFITRKVPVSCQFELFMIDISYENLSANILTGTFVGFLSTHLEDLNHWDLGLFQSSVLIISMSECGVFLWHKMFPLGSVFSMLNEIGMEVWKVKVSIMF